MPTLTWLTGKLRQRNSLAQVVISDRGFTLVELVVVMTMIALVSLTAIPAWQQFNRSMTLRGATLQFASLLRSAQLQSVEKGEERTVSVDWENNTYRLLPVQEPILDEVDSVPTQDSTATVKASNSLEVPRLLPVSVTMGLVGNDSLEGSSGITEDTSLDMGTTESPTNVVFYPDGSATSVVFELTNKNRTYRVAIRKATGSVQVVLVGS